MNQKIQRLKIFLVLIATIMLFKEFQSQNTPQIKVWTEVGQYYSQFCQLSFQIISTDLLQSQRIFITAEQNILFFDDFSRQNYYTVAPFNFFQSNKQFKINYIDSICKNFTTSSNKICVLLTTIISPPNKTPLRQTINSTHYALNFRINKAICPNNHLNNKIKLKIQISSNNLTQSSNQIIMRFSSSFIFKLSNLSYYGVQQQDFLFEPNLKYFLADSNQFNSLSQYNFILRIKNQTMALLWSKIQINFKNTESFLSLSNYSINTSTNISTICNQDFLLNKITIQNQNFVAGNRSLSYASFIWDKKEVLKDIFQLNFSTNLYFDSDQKTAQIQVIVYGKYQNASQFPQPLHSFNNNILSLNQNQFILGINSDTIYSLSLEQFNNLPQKNKKYPINWGKTEEKANNQSSTTNNNTSTTTTTTVATDSYLQILSRYLKKQYQKLIFSFQLIIIIIILFCSHQNYSSLEVYSQECSFKLFKFVFFMLLFFDPILTVILYITLQTQNYQLETAQAYQAYIMNLGFLISNLIIHGFFSILFLFTTCWSKNVVKKYFGLLLEEKNNQIQQSKQPTRSICWALIKVLYDFRFFGVILHQINAENYQGECSDGNTKNKKHKDCHQFQIKQQIQQVYCLKGIIKNPWIYNMALIGYLLSLIVKSVQFGFFMNIFITNESVIKPVYLTYIGISLIFLSFMCKKLYLYARVSKKKKNLYNIIEKRDNQQMHISDEINKKNIQTKKIDQSIKKSIHQNYLEMINGCISKVSKVQKSQKNQDSKIIKSSMINFEQIGSQKKIYEQLEQKIGSRSSLKKLYQ